MSDGGASVAAAATAGLLLRWRLISFALQAVALEMRMAWMWPSSASPWASLDLMTVTSHVWSAQWAQRCWHSTMCWARSLHQMHRCACHTTVGPCALACQHHRSPPALAHLACCVQVRAEYLCLLLAGLCVVVPEVEDRLKEVLPGRGRQRMAEKIEGAANGFFLAPSLSERSKQVSCV